MEIVVKGLNVKATADLREYVEKRFRVVERQVPLVAVLTMTLREDRNPAIADSQHAEATLALKGVTLHASSAAPEMHQAIHHCQKEIERQVVRLKEKRRKRREARGVRDRSIAA